MDNRRFSGFATSLRSGALLTGLAGILLMTSCGDEGFSSAPVWSPRQATWTPGGGLSFSGSDGSSTETVHRVGALDAWVGRAPGVGRDDSLPGKW